MTVESRFWAKVNQTSTCWLWTGGVAGRGYGVFGVNGKKVYVHRYSYELYHGPIPNGAQIDHRTSCPKNCVNPLHLRLTTPKQNQENRNGAQANSVTKVRGVSVQGKSGHYYVRVQHNGTTCYGGTYPTLAEAEAAAIALRVALFTHNDADRTNHA